MEVVSLDHSTISCFRSALTELGLMDKLLKAFNRITHHISVKEGVLFDASIVDSPHRSSGGHESESLKTERIRVMRVQKKKLTSGFFWRSAKGQIASPDGYRRRSIEVTIRNM